MLHLSSRRPHRSTVLAFAGVNGMYPTALVQAPGGGVIFKLTPPH